MQETIFRLESRHLIILLHLVLTLHCMADLPTYIHCYRFKSKAVNFDQIVSLHTIIVAAKTMSYGPR